MIEAHTLDAWTRLAVAAYARRSASPRFSAALPRRCSSGWRAWASCCRPAASARRATAAPRARWTRSCRRGLEIFILAFLFRLQAFIVSPGSSSRDAVSRRHPQRHGPGDRRGRARVGRLSARPVLQVAGCSPRSRSAVAMVTPIVRTLPIVDRAAHCGAVVRPAGRRLHDVHDVSLGRIRLRRRGVWALLARPATSVDERRLQALLSASPAQACSCVRVSTPQRCRDLRAVVVLDQLADLFCDSRRRDDDWRSPSSTAAAEVLPALGATAGSLGTFGRSSLVRLLDPRRAGVRLRDVAFAAADLPLWGTALRSSCSRR